MGPRGNYLIEKMLNMADVHDKATRSYNMSQVRSKNTIPEMLVRKFLHAYGFRYRLNVKDLPGKPDIVLPKYKTIIFIHGCFWHGHKDCKYSALPQTRREWWLAKINLNKINDAKTLKALQKGGWKIIVLWTCHLKKTSIGKTFEKLIIRLN
jgi:DNA mismatch endonuclease (patch repair protein)